jgi:hypothetical protein
MPVVANRMRCALDDARHSPGPSHRSLPSPRLREHKLTVQRERLRLRESDFGFARIGFVETVIAVGDPMRSLTIQKPSLSQ